MPVNPYDGNGYGCGIGYGYCEPMPSAAVPLLLDGLAATYGAWSVGRKLRSGFGNYSLLMRRSTDNDVTECTFDSNGLSDVGLVEDFSSGGNVFIDTLLNQDANGSTLDLAQATTALQPKICSSGTAITENGVLCAEFSYGIELYVGSSDGLFNFLHNGSNATLACVSKFGAAGGFQYILSSQGPDSFPIGLSVLSVSLTTYMQIGTSSSFAVYKSCGTSPTSMHVLSLFADADNATASSRASSWVNGASSGTNNSQTGTASASNSTTNLTLGGVSNSPHFNMTGRIAELIIWPTDERADRATWESDQASVYGITLA